MSIGWCSRSSLYRWNCFSNAWGCRNGARFAYKGCSDCSFFLWYTSQFCIHIRDKYWQGNFLINFLLIFYKELSCCNFHLALVKKLLSYPFPWCSTKLKNVQLNWFFFYVHASTWLLPCFLPPFSAVVSISRLPCLATSLVFI